MACPSPRQGLQEDYQFWITAHETRQATRSSGLQARARGTGPDQLEDLHWHRQALYRHRPQGVNLDQAFDQAQRRCC